MEFYFEKILETYQVVNQRRLRLKLLTPSVTMVKVPFSKDVYFSCALLGCRFPSNELTASVELLSCPHKPLDIFDFLQL